MPQRDLLPHDLLLRDLLLRDLFQCGLFIGDARQNDLFLCGVPARRARAYDLPLRDALTAPRSRLGHYCCSDLGERSPSASNGYSTVSSSGLASISTNLCIVLYCDQLRCVVEMEMPSELAVNLTVKVGLPLSNTRTVYGKPISMTLVVAERYGVFRARVQERIGAMKEIVWKDGAEIYLRPTANTRQSQYEPLHSDAETFDAQLQHLWRFAARRKQG